MSRELNKNWQDESKKMSFSENDLMVETARLYYYEGLTQDRIGEVLGLSRQKVWRLLSRARYEGIVQVRIVNPRTSTSSKIAEELRDHFGLREVVGVPVFSDDETVVRKRVGQAAASYLFSHVEPRATLGVSYGKTLFEMASFLAPKNVAGLRVIQIMGGYGRVKGEAMAIELARRIASSFGGEAVYLLAPAFARDKATREALISEGGVEDVISMWEELDIALVGIGGVTPSSTLLDTGDFHTEEVEDILDHGAVGNICGNFYTIKGEPVSCHADKRRISMSLEKLQEVPQVLGAAGGKEKVQAVLGALRGKLVDILITDERTAERVLQADN